MLDCSDNWQINQKKIIYETNECIDNYQNSPEYKYEYNGKSYNSCPKGLFDSLEKKCKYQLDKCLLCPPISLSKNSCTECNTNHYQKENDFNKIGEYIDCYKEPG